MDAIDELLDGYVARKRAENEASERKRLADAELRERAKLLLSAVVLPILRELATAIQAKGHQCEVKERFSSYFPSAELEFQPADADGPTIRNIFPSTISFGVASAKHCEVRREVKSAKNDGNYKSTDDCPLSELSEAKVRFLATAFVESVLRAN